MGEILVTHNDRHRLWNTACHRTPLLFHKSLQRGDVFRLNTSLAVFDLPFDENIRVGNEQRQEWIAKFHARGGHIEFPGFTKPVEILSQHKNGLGGAGPPAAKRRNDLQCPRVHNLTLVSATECFVRRAQPQPHVLQEFGEMWKQWFVILIEPASTEVADSQTLRVNVTIAHEKPDCTTPTCRRCKLRMQSI